MGTLTFYDYAMDDYSAFKECYEAGFVRNNMGVLAEQACEKFLKDIICRATKTENYMEIPVDKSILHSLKSMAFFIKDELGYPNSYDLRHHLATVERFYKDTRYPGYWNSHMITKEEIKECAVTLRDCKKYADACIEMIAQKQGDRPPEENLVEL